jgi:hypothetical protein
MLAEPRPRCCKLVGGGAAIILAALCDASVSDSLVLPSSFTSKREPKAISPLIVPGHPTSSDVLQKSCDSWR